MQKLANYFKQVLSSVILPLFYQEYRLYIGLLKNMDASPLLFSLTGSNQKAKSFYFLIEMFKVGFEYYHLWIL